MDNMITNNAFFGTKTTAIHPEVQLMIFNTASQVEWYIKQIRNELFME